MNKNQKLIIKLLNCSIRKEKLSGISYKEINWDYIMKEATAHNIYPLLYPVVKDILSLNKTDMKQRWELTTFNTAIYFNRQIAQLSTVFSKFNEKNIPVIALKGLFLRNYYPYPDLRTMGDADILVQKEYIKEVQGLLISLGYIQIEETTPVHIAFMHEHYCPIEVHWALADNRYIKDISQFENEVWSAAVLKKIRETDVLCLCPEDFLVHLFIHMAAHMKSSGFGLRQLCDLVLLIEGERQNINWQTFSLKIKTNSLERFASAIISICNILFNLNVPQEYKHINIDKKYIKMLIANIFDSGVFGKKSLHRIFGNNLLNSEQIYEFTDCSKPKSILYVVFPPVNNLDDKYGYAKKNKILIPIAWIHHFLSGIFNKEFSISEKISSVLFSTSVFRKKKELLKNLDL